MNFTVQDIQIVNVQLSAMSNLLPRNLEMEENLKPYFYVFAQLVLYKRSCQNRFFFVDCRSSARGLDYF